MVEEGIIRGIHHTSFTTQNFEGMLHFYRDLLGLEEIFRNELIQSEILDYISGIQNTTLKNVMLRAGNMIIEIFQYISPEGKAGNPNRPANDVGLTHVCFDVVNIFPIYNRLKAAGVEFNCEPQNFKDRVWSTYGRDPDGNLFELQEIIDPSHPAMLKWD
ncbi:VOC family protein [Neobacillus mesonae]|uniref:VOC family protein n=1 Tax=Neobacillus mesonae TaxID=1193713 RepID=UPI00203B3AFD|nr:VOC family protein [Neobacillus mesonae]MCM3567488.1 VOC family protein [Neobacillus mesonae]